MRNVDTNVLRLREYQSADIGTTWNPAAGMVPESFVREIDNRQRATREEYLSVSRRQIRAKHFVGVIGCGERTIEILPKTDVGDGRTRERVVQMLDIAGLVPRLNVGIASLASRALSLLDAYMLAYLRELTIEWRRGHIAGYESIERNRTALRGRLLFHEQIRENRLRPERFYTRADEHQADVRPAQILRAGIQVCRRYGGSEEVRREARMLLGEFDQVSDRWFDRSELAAFTSDRRLQRFDPLLRLATQLLNVSSPDGAGGDKTFTLLFDMNRVFESYIGNLLRRVCEPSDRVNLQVSGQSLVRRLGKKCFRLRPDIGIHRGGRYRCLIDTKWKRLDPSRSYHGIQQSDMYQAYAYAREYDCPRVILLYPRFDSLQPLISEYHLQPVENKQFKVEIRTVDIAQPVKVVVDSLRKLVNENNNAMAK